MVETPIDAIFESIAWLKLFMNKSKTMESISLENEITHNSLEMITEEVTTTLMYLQPESVALMRIVSAFEEGNHVNFKKINGLLDEDDKNDKMMEELKAVLKVKDTTDMGMKITKKNINELKEFLVSDESVGKGFLNQLLGKEIDANGRVEREEIFNVIFENKKDALQRLNNLEKELYDKRADTILEKYGEESGIKNKQFLWKVLQDPSSYTNPQFKNLLSDRAMAYAVTTEMLKFELHQMTEAYKRSSQYKKNINVKTTNFKGENITYNIATVKDLEQRNIISQEHIDVYNSLEEKVAEVLEENGGIPVNEDAQKFTKEIENATHDYEQEIDEYADTHSYIYNGSETYRKMISVLNEKNIEQYALALLNEYNNNDISPTERREAEICAVAISDYNNLNDGRLLNNNDAKKIDDIKPKNIDITLNNERMLACVDCYHESINEDGNFDWKRLKEEYENIKNDSVDAADAIFEVGMKSIIFDYMRSVNEDKNVAEEKIINSMSDLIGKIDFGNEKNINNLKELSSDVINDINDNITNSFSKKIKENEDVIIRNINEATELNSPDVEQTSYVKNRLFELEKENHELSAENMNLIHEQNALLEQVSDINASIISLIDKEFERNIEIDEQEELVIPTEEGPENSTGQSSPAAPVE